MDEMSRKELFFNKIAIYFCVAIAIFFFVAGIYELQVNAAELEPYINLTYTTQIDYTVSGKEGYTFYNYDGLQLTGRLAESGFDNFAILRINQENESGEIYGYKYEIYVVDTSGYSAKLSVGYDASFSSIPEYAYYKSGIQPTSSSMSWKDIYLSDFESVNFMDLRPSGWKSYPTYNRIDVDTNIPMFIDMTHLENYLLTGDTTGQIMDYSQLQTDDTIGTIDKPLMNIIVNEVLEENDLISGLPSKIYEVYNYIVWENTENLDLQVEVAPFVNINKGLFNKSFWKQIKGDWEYFEILPSGTSSLTQRSDMYYLEETNSKYIDFLNVVEDEYGGLNKECELFFAYRFRYIDVSTMRAGKWVYLVPSSNGYMSFIEYLDETKSSYVKSDGVSVETENVEDINTIKDSIDLENEFLEKYENLEIDVEDATTWLTSVAEFIKGTPSFVGSVMSFLPDPIRYGMYVCLFLGVIASGYAIVKALI